MLSGVALQGATTRLATPRSVFETVTSIVPTSRRQFLRSETVAAFAHVYQGGTAPLAPVATRVHVVDATAKSVFGGTATIPAGEFGQDRSAELKLAIPLQRLPPGDYLLTLEAELGKNTARRDVRFTVR